MGRLDLLRLGFFAMFFWGFPELLRELARDAEVSSCFSTPAALKASSIAVFRGRFLDDIDDPHDHILWFRAKRSLLGKNVNPLIPFCFKLCYLAKVGGDQSVLAASV